MSVWFAIPSKKPAAEAERTLWLWRNKGYRLAIWRDEGDEPVECDLLLIGPYPGYANAVNALCREILGRYRETEWIVSGGDDVEPDPNHTADEIAQECSEHFTAHIEITRHGSLGPQFMENCPTWGIMQPTGDRWGEDASMPNVRPDRAAYSDRVCGSPWLGAEFCRRMYGGQGPLWPGWTHMYEDEELQAVAERLGILWQRRDLTHFHRHYARERKPMPEYMRQPNSEFAKWGKVFAERQAAGFPGHQPV